MQESRSFAISLFLFVRAVVLRIEQENASIALAGPLRAAFNADVLDLREPACMLDNEVKIAVPNEQDSFEIAGLYFPHEGLDGVAIENHVPDRPPEETVAPARDLLNPGRRHGIMDVSIVHFAYGDPSLVRKPPNDCVRHP